MDNWHNWDTDWLRAATYYFDPVNGSDSNAGTSATLPWKTTAKAEQTTLSVGQSIAKKVSGKWILYKTATARPTNGIIAAYYLGDTAMPISGIDFGAITHVHHDHIEPLTDGSLDITTRPIPASASAALISAARSAGVRAVITVADIFGGDFPGASSSGTLNTFVKNLVNFVLSRGYDGIDIDWERNLTTAPYVTLMSALYPAIKEKNPNLTVSLAGSYSNENGTYIVDRFAAVAPYVDYLTAMAYDLYAPAALTSWHNAALFDGNNVSYYATNLLSGYRLVRAFVSSGVPASKILLGVPFYGRLFSGSVGAPNSGILAPRQNYTGSPTNTYLFYNQLPAYDVPSAERWDALAQVPYLSLSDPTPANNKYLSYDDCASITAKVEWVRSRGLAGLGIWELSQDYFPTRTITNALINAVKLAYPKPPVVAGATPSAPTITAQAISTTGVTINATLVPAATSYRIKRSTTSGSGYTTLAEITGTTYTDSSVAANTTYYYVVSAVANGTLGANSNEIPVHTSTSTVTNLLTSPADITNAAWTLGGTGATKTGASTFTAASSGASSLAQTVSVAASTNYTATITLTPSGSPGFAALNVYTTAYASLGGQGQYISSGSGVYTVTFNSGANTSVIFELDVDASFNSVSLAVSSPSLILSSSIVIPSAPGSVAASSVTSTTALNVEQTTISWSAVAGATSYLVKRSASIAGGPYTIRATVTGTSYTDATLAPNIRYYYVVTAVENLLESANSTEVSALGGAYTPVNLLASPTDITNVAWILGGTASATGPLALNCATSGVTSLVQINVPVSSSTAYVAKITVTASASGYATLSVYAPGWTPIPASQGQSLTAGVAATFTVPFTSGGNTSVIFELDLDANFVGGTATIADASVSVPVAGDGNLLTSGGAINVAPWIVGGTAASTPNANHLLCASSGATSLAQVVAVTPNTDVTASITVSNPSAVGYAVLDIFAAGYASVLAAGGKSLSADAQTITLSFNTGANSSIVFELDIDASANGNTLAVSGASLGATPSWIKEW